MQYSQSSRVSGTLHPSFPPPQEPFVNQAHLARRIATFERLRRGELLIPATLAMMVLTLSGYLPALVPVVVPAMAGALALVLLIFGGTIALVRAKHVQAASICYIIGLLLFYSVALYITPTGSSGQLSASNFTAGNLYYFLADVLPIFASTLLLDEPGPIFVNIVVFVLNMICIWILPHDATFNDFTRHLGGPLFLAASATLGQFVLIVFGLAASRTIRRALIAASRAADLEEINQIIGSRQQQLEEDIRRLQEMHAQIANNRIPQVTLATNSELYPIAISLNLIVERLARFRQSDKELHDIEQGLLRANAILTRMGQGDLSTLYNGPSTGTRVDGLLATLIQVQGQIATWVQDLKRINTAVLTSQSQTHKDLDDLILGVQQVRFYIEQGPQTGLNTSTLGLDAVDAQSMQLQQNITTTHNYQRQVMERLDRISLGTPTR